MTENSPQDNVIDLQEYKENNQPHHVAELICLSCKDRWVGVWAQKTYLKDLICKCEVKGQIIRTGQYYKEFDE